MKRILALALIIGWVAGAWAQGTLQFTVSPSGSQEVPPNSSLNTDVPGTLTLIGTSLTYEFGVIIGNGQPLPTDATINGPAPVGQNAPVLFDLGAGSPFPGINPPIGRYWQGSIVNLTSIQVDELVAGEWYINVLTDSSFPGGQYRGQIAPVPEPSSLALLGMAGSAWLVWRRRRPVL